MCIRDSLNPEGPLAIRPGHLPSALPWLFKFLRNARPHRVAQICHGLGMLTAHAQEDFDEVIEAALATYASPAYQKALEALDGGVVRDLRIVEGID